MTEDLARVVTELAELVESLTTEAAPAWRGGGAQLAARARRLAGRLSSDDPARWAGREPTVTVEVDVPARVVVDTLAAEGTGAVLVMASGGPVGIVAERDVVAALAAGSDLDALSAADLIATDLVAASPEASVAETAALMVSHRVRHLPMTNGVHVTGMISALDLLRALVDEPGDR
jgi:CBS domain-containing protein